MKKKEKKQQLNKQKKPTGTIKHGMCLSLSHLLGILTIDSSGAEIGIFQDNKVNTTAADGLATLVARASAAMVLVMRVK